MRTKVSSQRRKWSILLAMCVMLALPLSVEAQKVNLKLKDATVQQAIQSLQKQGYSISVKISDVDMDAAVSIDAKDEELSSVLGKIFAGQNVETTVDGKSIIVTKRAAVAQAPARTTTVAGVVKDAAGNPLIGVTVWVEGTTNGTTTDMQGKYTLTAKSNDTLGFSYIGYTDVMEAVGRRSTIDVVLKESATSMDEVVVVGYGTQSRRTLTTAISKVDGATLFDAPVSNVGDALKGKVSGLRVASNNTIAGEAPRFMIRGGSSINLSNDPVVIVDGVTRDMNDINPNDIESIEVLKDAASAGIYGARASNGVILVTTKRGTKSTPEIIFDAQLGWTSPARKWDLMNAKEFISFVRPAIVEGPNAAGVLNGANAAGTGNTAPNSTFTTRFLEHGEDPAPGWQWMEDPINPGKFLTFKDTDHQSAWFGNAFWHKEYVGVNGGSDKVKYAASVSYLGDDGMVAMSKYKVFTMHGNTSFNVTKNLVASTTFDLSRSKKNPLVTNYFNSMGRGIMMAPTSRNYDEDGNWITGGTNKNQQTAAFYEQFYDRETQTTRMMGNFNLKWTITKGLTATAQYAMFNNAYRGSYYAFGADGDSPNFIDTTRSTTETRTETHRDSFQAFLNYKGTFKDVHNLNVTAGYDYMKWRYWYLTATSKNSVSDKVPILSSGTEFEASNKDEIQALISYFGRVNYDYDNRYVASFTFRADGSSKFAPGNQWGYFPAGSVAWIISEEPFWDVSKSKMNTFKFRASYGQTGNNGIGLYDTYGAFSPSVYGKHSTMLPSAMMNSGMKWETTTQLDLGLDMGFFNDRLRVVVDYYNKVTDNMLFSITLPDTGSFGSVKANIGSARFYGFELEINSVNIQKKNFTWTTSFTYSFSKNKVLSLPDEYKYTDLNGKDAWRIGGYKMSVSGERFGGTAVGEELGRIWGYKISHIIESEAEADAALFDAQGAGYRRSDGQSIAGRKDVGDYAFMNREGSARLPNGDEQIDGEDMFCLGNVVPHSTGGLGNTFKYKNLSLHIYVDYAIGHSIYNYMKSRMFQNTLGNSNSNLDKMVYDCWTAPGEGKYARFFPNDADFGNRNFSRASDFNVERADYLCLRDVSLFYDLPQKWTKKVGIKKVTVGVTGNTLCYWTGLSGAINPETGIATDADAGMYSSVNNGSSNGSIAPPARKVLFNVKLTF
ncbi:MAG: TonB-dependent receptor [Alistipes sp.]|nr:TonB-dependent receptor [Alistipes sp.]